MKMPNVVIDTDTEVDFADSGAWRSFQLTTHGSSLTELMTNATIAEIDQDGGDINCYDLEDASNEIQDVCDCIIAREFVKALDALKTKVPA